MNLLSTKISNTAGCFRIRFVSFSMSIQIETIFFQEYKFFSHDNFIYGKMVTDVFESSTVKLVDKIASHGLQVT